MSSLLTSLASALQGTSAQVVGPNAPNYSELMGRWSVVAEAKPAAIVLPTSTQEISLAIKAARAASIPFVIAGGRHSVSGCSSSTHLVIDLRRMNQVTVDKQHRTLHVQGGATWADVDREAAAEGFCTVGGTVNHTGVGGLTLGGGIGWLNGLYGLAIDNLLSCEAVLADGTIARASETKNVDLFWALRGAGPSFAAVSEFVFKAHDLPETVYSGPLVFTPDKLEALVDYLNEQFPKVQDHQAAVFAFAVGPHGPAVLAVPFHLGDEKSARAAFSGLFQLGHVADHTHSMQYPALNGMLNEGMEHGGIYSIAGASFTMPLDKSKVRAVWDKYEKTVAEIGGKITMIWELFPQRKVQAVPIESTAYANRGDSYNMAIVLKTDNLEKADMVRQRGRDIARQIRDTMGPKDREVIYGNVLAQGPRSSARVFGPNHKRLVELKKKYDPDNCFNRWHDILESA